MPEDKIIKSGQITAPRILFLAICGAVLVVIVAKGYLTVGYMLLTAVLCILLGLIAADYGVAMDKVDMASNPTPVNPPMTGATGSTDVTVAGVGKTSAPAADTVKVKKRPGRPAKRRR